MLDDERRRILKIVMRRRRGFSKRRRECGASIAESLFDAGSRSRTNRVRQVWPQGVQPRTWDEVCRLVVCTGSRDCCEGTHDGTSTKIEEARRIIGKIIITAQLSHDGMKALTNKEKQYEGGMPKAAREEIGKSRH